MTPKVLRLGEFEVQALRDGWLSVEAEAMFGAAPRPAWAKGFVSGDMGRLAVSLNVFLIKSPGAMILVDTGAGESLDDQLQRSYGFRKDPGLPEALRRAGFDRRDIDLVINTHLHFDHCGGNVRSGKGGVLEPAFPRAKYIVQRGERQTALDPPRRERPNYRASSILPVEARGRLRLVEGDASVASGVDVVFAPGHTRHHQCVRVESRGRSLIILGDLVPTSVHVPLSRATGYDLCPAELKAVKAKLLDPGPDGSRLFAFGHDPVHPFGRVLRRGGRPVFRPLAD